MKKILIILIISLLMGNWLFPQEILFQDDFESYEVGSFPSSPWFIAYNGSGEENQIIVNEYFISPTQSLELECAPGWAAHAHFKLSKKPTIIYHEGSFMVEDIKSIIIIGFVNPDIGTWGADYGCIRTDNHGYIYGGYYNDKEKFMQVLQPYETNKWYQYKIRYNSYLDICDVWIDGIQKGQNLKCENLGEYNEFVISVYNKDLASKAWFDDVKIYADSSAMMFHTFFTGAYLYLKYNPDSANVYFNESLNYLKANKNKLVASYLPVNLLKYLMNSAFETDSAQLYLQSILEWYETNGFLFMSMIVSNELTSFYYEKNQIYLAEEYCHQSKSVFDEMISKNSWYRSDSLEFIQTYDAELYYPLLPEQMKEMIWILGKTMYYKFYQINETRNRIEKALEYHITYSNVNDTLNKIRQSNESSELLNRNELEEKRGNQRFIEQWLRDIYSKSNKLKQTQLFLIGLGMLVIFVVILAIVFIQQNKLRNEQQKLQLQQKLFRSQMNPHFIFNSLTSIQNFILDEDAHIASKYLSRFSKLVRNILDSSVEDYVPLEEEIITIENYLELQKIRFQDKFDYSIYVDEKINPENINIPPMLAQPFIENSIEHGIKNKKSKGNISIRFKSKDNYIIFEVEDDGVGREQAREILLKMNKDHKSLATAITHERIQVLNKKLKEKIVLYIKDLFDTDNKPSGTLVQIEIPLL